MCYWWCLFQVFFFLYTVEFSLNILSNLGYFRNGKRFVFGKDMLLNHHWDLNTSILLFFFWWMNTSILRYFPFLGHLHVCAITCTEKSGENCLPVLLFYLSHAHNCSSTAGWYVMLSHVTVIAYRDEDISTISCLFSHYASI